MEDIISMRKRAQTSKNRRWKVKNFKERKVKLKKKDKKFKNKRR